MRALNIIALIGVLVAPRSVAAQAVHYKVIVNANNPAAVLRASELSKIYLGTANLWPDRTPVLAVDQKSGSPLHETFIHEIIGKDSSMLNRYWEQAIFSGRAIPPLSLTSDGEVVEFVRRNTGAIAYVEATTILSPEIKVIRIVR